MKMQRLFALILCILMLLGLLTGCDRLAALSPDREPAPTEAPILPNDPEIQAAVEYGLVPEELQGGFGSGITYAEFCSILDAMISQLRPDRTSDWKTRSAPFRGLDNQLTRMEGMLVFLYAAECAGLDAVGFENNIPLEDLMPEGMDFWEGVTWDYRLIPGSDEIYSNEIISASPDYGWRCGYSYTNNAAWFAQYCSYGNGKTYFDYDENYSFRLGDALTLGDAVRAVERLYETGRYASYVSAKGLTHGVSAAAIAYASRLPDANYRNLPAWRGHAIKGRSETANSAMGIRYTESEVAAIASYGFNFVRVPLDFRLLFNGTDTGKVNVGYLSSIDELINWCAEYGIHVCLSLHDMPGFTTNGDDSDDNLFTDSYTQTLFYQFWLFLAEYYKDVPARLLSFNLLNEPHGGEGETLTDAAYSDVMLPIIKSILVITPDRLMFTDMLRDAETPVRGLEDAPVAQSFHSYFLSDGTEAWPSYTINGLVHRDQGSLTIKGDFPAGTQIDISFVQAHRTSEIRLRAGRTTVGEHAIGGEDTGAGQCIGVTEAGTDSEWRSYQGRNWTTVLEKAATELRLEQTGSGRWYAVDRITLTLPNRTLMLTGNRSDVTSAAAPVLTMAADGTITAEDAGTLLRMDRAALTAQLQTYANFTARTGQAVMAQAFGFNTSISTDAALDAAGDFLSILDAYGIPWCCWHGDYGVLVHESEAEMNAIKGNRSLLRNDAVYEDAGDGWLAFADMMTVFQRHMK